MKKKLLLGGEEIKSFVEESLVSEKIQPFWKDDILISVLLSDYSKHFFENFKEELLKNNQALLKRLSFLLRIACKEVDNDILNQLGIKSADLFTLKYVLTKPKGNGWEYIRKMQRKRS